MAEKIKAGLKGMILYAKCISTPGCGSRVFQKEESHPVPSSYLFRMYDYHQADMTAKQYRQYNKDKFEFKDYLIDDKTLHIKITSQLGDDASFFTLNNETLIIDYPTGTYVNPSSKKTNEQSANNCEGFIKTVDGKTYFETLDGRIAEIYHYDLEVQILEDCELELY